MPTTAEIRAQLTAPGARFAVLSEPVGDRVLDVFQHRLRSMREIAALAYARGETTFLAHGDLRLSFSRFIELANSVSGGLAAAGVDHGDRVAILAQNSPEWCTAFWGIVALGAIAVGVNGWWNADEILFALRDSGARVLIADRKRFDRIAGALDRCPDLSIVYVTDADRTEFAPRVPPRINVRPYADLTASPTAELPTSPIAEDDTALIFYTSGTTGRSKGAITTHRNMIALLQIGAFNAAVADLARAEPRPVRSRRRRVALFTNPLFHLSGCHLTLVTGVLAGTTLIMPEGRFDPEQVLRLIEREQVTMWSAVPTMLWRVCEQAANRAYDTSTVVTIGYGGSPASVELRRMIHATFPNVRSTSNGYGLTETGGIAINSGADMARKPWSVGPPLPTVQVKIVDDHGVEVPIGSPGEICARSAAVIPGYWNQPEATSETIVDGWFHTGDIGFLDDEGFLTLTDRKKDMIIRGGENVYCAEIEQRLVEHPAITDAAVIGVPHAELGEEVKAVVQIVPGQVITADDVRAWVAKTLADFKVPAHVELVDEKLPRNAGGKLLKNVLRGADNHSFEETM